MKYHVYVYVQVLQRDVETHGRIVSSVVRLCGGGDAARALERRWHLLYLRAIEWQCHLEACLARIDNQVTYLHLLLFRFLYRTMI